MSKLDLDAIEEMSRLPSGVASALRKKLVYLQGQEAGIHVVQSRILRILTEKEVEQS